MVGVIAGLFAGVLFWGVHFCADVLLREPLAMPDDLAGKFILSAGGMALLLLIPTLGGLAVGLIVKNFCPEAAGGGTTEILVSYHNRNAVMVGTVIPYKWLASCLTIGTGGSGGTEGPMAQIGAAIGSWLAQTLGLDEAERGLLFTAGIAGGIGAVFRAPLGGALFACEMYYSSAELESQALVPSLIASVCAYFMFGLFFGFHPLLPGESSLDLNPRTFGILTAIAVLCALVARFYVFWLGFCSEIFKKHLPYPWRPSLGGFCNGVLALVFLLLARHYLDSNARILAVLSEGYPILDSAVLGGALPLLLLLVGTGKLLTSGFTVGSGGAAGVFAPSMVIGGCIGGLVAIWLATHGLSDGGPKAFVLAGMAAFFAAGTACPLASLIIITEVAQGYSLLPALMWVVALGYLLRPRPGLFRAQVRGSADSPLHRTEIEAAFLASRRVGQLCRRQNIETVAEGCDRLVILKKALENGQKVVPILNSRGHFLSALVAPNAGQTLSSEWTEASIGQLVQLNAEQDLGLAIKILKTSSKQELPVLDEMGNFVGLFGYTDIVS